IYLAANEVVFITDPLVVFVNIYGAHPYIVLYQRIYIAGHIVTIYGSCIPVAICFSILKIGIAHPVSQVFLCNQFIDIKPNRLIVFGMCNLLLRISAVANPVI